MAVKGIGVAVAGKWVAGASVESAISRCAKLNERGVVGIINYLGEEIRDARKVDATKKVYISIIERISKTGIRADISMKPTQLGLLLDFRTALKNYLDVLDRAEKAGVFVWLDMEGHKFVSGTIKLYKEAARYKNRGICIQACLKRSNGDLGRMRSDAIIRLVKGAHAEPHGASFTARSDITRNYFDLMDRLFLRFKRFTIATHDSGIIEHAIKLNKRYRRDVTYAMLLGIRNNMAYDMAKRGYSISIYVPFGQEWLPYAARRLKEKQNAGLFLRSLISG